MIRLVRARVAESASRSMAMSAMRLTWSCCSTMLRPYLRRRRLAETGQRLHGVLQVDHLLLQRRVRLADLRRAAVGDRLHRHRLPRFSHRVIAQQAKSLIGS